MVKYMGVDLSYCNTAIDYKKLKSGKIDGGKVKFAMLRTSYGYNKDKLLDKHYKGCKEAGIYVGAYHWLKAQNPSQAKQEAEWLCNLIKNYEFDYPIALDFEDENLFALGLTKEKYSAIIDAFMTVLQNNNYYVVLYTNPDTIKNRITETTFKKYDLWLAHWTHGNPPAQYGQTMWQFAAYGTGYEVSKGWATDVGEVSGSGGSIDVDVSYVGYASKIRKSNMNKQSKKVTIIGTKIIDEKNLEKETKKMQSLGFDVSINK